MAKGTILFMTSQLKADRTIPYCNRQLGEHSQVIEFLIICSINKMLQFVYPGRDRQFVVSLPEEERIAWIWCILVAFAVPEIGTLFRSIRMCVFKSWKKPQSSHFFLVFAMETFHVLGLALMFLAVLPELDVVKGAMLTNCVSFVPCLLGRF